MGWVYNGKRYCTILVDWGKIIEICPLDKYLETFESSLALAEKSYDKQPNCDRVLFYHNKWNKCFTALRFGFFGRGNKIKFCLEEIYTKNFYYAMAKDVELIIESK